MPCFNSSRGRGASAKQVNKLQMVRLRYFIPLIALMLFPWSGKAQIATDTVYNPEVIYSPIPKQYEIAGISVSGIPQSDAYLIINHSGLSVGDKVEIPGDAITLATKRLWRQGLYSKVEINVAKTSGEKAWLEIVLRQQPRLSELRFEGVSGGDKKNLIERLGMVSGQQLTPNIIARAKQIIENFYAAKGFKNIY